VNKKIILIISLALALLVSFIALNIKRLGSGPIRADTVASASVLINQAKGLEAKGNLADARAAYQKLINEFSNSSDVMNWQKKIEEINIKLLFSPAITAGSILYEIKPGDTLAKIAKEFKTTADLIIKSNNLSGDKIVPSRKIKVWAAPFNILVDKSQNTLTLKANEEIIKTYIVSTGKNNSTPAGNFKIMDKIPNPPWFKPGASAPIPSGSPENILGSRWLALDLPSYGIHGTTDPQSLGKQVTQGCVRMANPDVEELYIIVPKGTEVTIID
jgi:lipoprotein-anchoring transpeptidase ErfK/SrfK